MYRRVLLSVRVIISTQAVVVPLINQRRCQSDEASAALWLTKAESGEPQTGGSAVVVVTLHCFNASRRSLRENQSRIDAG